MKHKIVKASIVIPVLITNQKQVAMTYRCLDSMRRNTILPYELIIVESGTQYLSEEADVYVFEKQVTTPEISHNRGFKVARGEYTVLLTNDVFVSEGWLESLYECFEKTPDCGAATLASTQFNHIKEPRIEEGNWFSVAMIPNKIFGEIGYYDERFVNSWCDTDWLIRLYKRDYKMYRNFNCVVEHLIGQTNYAKEGFNKNYEEGRALFNEKHKDCGLKLFEAVR